MSPIIVSLLIIILVSCLLQKRQTYSLLYIIQIAIECLNEVLPTESLCDYFSRHGNACPVFFMGSFQTAYQIAFNSTVIQEVHLTLFS
jgi:hypothetical protein